MLTRGQETEVMETDVTEETVLHRETEETETHREDNVQGKGSTGRPACRPTAPAGFGAYANAHMDKTALAYAPKSSRARRFATPIEPQRAALFVFVHSASLRCYRSLRPLQIFWDDHRTEPYVRAATKSAARFS